MPTSGRRSFRPDGVDRQGSRRRQLPGGPGAHRCEVGPTLPVVSPTRTTPPFHLFHAVLQRTDHGVLVAQPRQPAPGLLILSVFDGKKDDVYRTVYLGGVSAYRTRQHDRILVVGAYLDLF